jgi:hypothetical protein
MWRMGCKALTATPTLAVPLLLLRLIPPHARSLVVPRGSVCAVASHGRRAALSLPWFSPFPSMARNIPTPKPPG